MLLFGGESSGNFVGSSIIGNVSNYMSVNAPDNGGREWRIVDDYIQTIL